MTDGTMKYALYPNGLVVLTLEGGYSLQPDFKIAAKQLRIWADEISAHGAAAKSNFAKQFAEIWKEAGFKPPTAEAEIEQLRDAINWVLTKSGAGIYGSGEDMRFGLDGQPSESVPPELRRCFAPNSGLKL
jgi:hypothetical protein